MAKHCVVPLITVASKAISTWFRHGVPAAIGFGQIKVSDKSNEITAIPELLDLLELKGAIVTIDAMGCQRNIAAKIVGQEANYVLALKGNQGTLHEDIELFFQEQKKHDFTDAKADTHETIEKDHGRLESRRVTVCAGIDGCKHCIDGPGLNPSSWLNTPRRASQPATRPAITSHRLLPRHPQCPTPFVTTGGSKMASTGSWTWPSVMTNAAFVPLTLQPISSPSNMPPATFAQLPRQRKPSVKTPYCRLGHRLPL